MFMVDVRGVEPSITESARMNARPRPPAGTVRSVSGPIPFHDVTLTPWMLMVPYWAVIAETSLTAPLGRLCRRSSFTSPDRFSVAPPWTIRSELISQTPGADCTRGAAGGGGPVSLRGAVAARGGGGGGGGGPPGRAPR